MLNIEINDKRELKIILPTEDSAISNALKKYVEPFAKEQDALILQGLKLRKEKSDKLIPQVEKFLTTCEFEILRALNSGFSNVKIKLPSEPEINSYIRKNINREKIIFPDGRVMKNTFTQMYRDFERNSCSINSDVTTEIDTKDSYLEIYWSFERSLTAAIFDVEVRKSR